MDPGHKARDDNADFGVAPERRGTGSCADDWIAGACPAMTCASPAAAVTRTGARPADASRPVVDQCPAGHARSGTGRARRRRGRGDRGDARAASPGSGREASMPALEATERIDLAGRWVTPGLDRLPHAPGVWRQSRARVRAAAGGCQLRGDRARRRRHPLHREGDARGVGGRAGRRGPAAARRPDRRGRDDRRDQVRLRPRARDRGPAAAGGAAAGRAAPRLGGDHLPRRACAAARGGRRQGPVHRAAVQPDAARDRARGTSRCGRRVHGGHRLQRRADSARVRGGEAAGPAGEAARRPAFQPRRRGAGGPLRRAVGRSSGIHRRGRRRGHGQGRHRGGAVAGRVLLHPRDAQAAGRALPQASACRSPSQRTAIRARRRSPRCC